MWCGGVVVWWCGGVVFLTDNNTTPTKLFYIVLLVGLWQLATDKQTDSGVFRSAPQLKMVVAPLRVA